MHRCWFIYPPISRYNLITITILMLCFPMAWIWSMFGFPSFEGLQSKTNNLWPTLDTCNEYNQYFPYISFFESQVWSNLAISFVFMHMGTDWFHFHWYLAIWCDLIRTIFSHVKHPRSKTLTERQTWKNNKTFDIHTEPCVVHTQHHRINT